MKKQSSLNRKADFSIEIDFQKGSESPSRIFRTMTGLIETFQELDKALVNSIDTKIEPVMIIEDIETGSIKGWFSTILKNVDDDALKKLDWKPLVGQYLVKAKYYILDFMDGKTQITSIGEIEDLERKLLKSAEETDVTHFPSYTPIQRQKLFSNIKRITDALGYLNESDKASYISSENEIIMNAQFDIVPEKIEELLTQEQIGSYSEMILKVKKPDYLGESMWEFRHGTRTILAKIVDLEWLKSFQNREKDVRPGDSLRAQVETIVSYGYDNEVVGIHHNITEVKNIIPAKSQNQLPLLPE